MLVVIPASEDFEYFIGETLIPTNGEAPFYVKILVRQCGAAGAEHCIWFLWSNSMALIRHELTRHVEARFETRQKVQVCLETAFTRYAR